ncbi:MAG: methyltransferase domain-containing protein [Pseudonocardiales bacterium]
MSPAITPVVATAVVDGYELRARFARADADAVSRPRSLRGLLRTTRHVAEVPCGAGHFLADYAATGVTTTLIDGNGAMLAAAIAHAADSGLPAVGTHAYVQYVQELGELAGVDLVVIPNAALNQLACQTPLVELLAAIRHALRPGVELLAQVACTHPGGGIDTAGCYDPVRQQGVWFADRYLDPSRAGGAGLRRRCQHRHHEGNGAVRVRVEFDYVDPTGASLHTTSVELRLFSAEELAAALTSAGFSRLRFLPGYGGLSDITARAAGGDAR